MLYNKIVIPSLKGSAFVSSTMIACHKTPLDHLMYYDAAAPGMWNGLFDKDTFIAKKPYHSLWFFSRLYLQGNEVKCECEAENVYALAAVSNDGKEATVFASYYKDLESYDGTGCDGETRELRIDWSDFASENGVKVTYRLIDKEHDGDIVSEETFFGSSGAHILNLPLYTSVLVTLTKL